MRGASLLAALVFAAGTSAAAVTVEIHRISPEGVGETIGTIELSEHAGGLLLKPQFERLPPGPHGFHVHENSSCQPGTEEGERQGGLAAGGHYDPQNTGSHEGPYGQGHLGDLPILYVRADGTAQDAVLAPRLELEDVRGRSLIIHREGDTYSDEPEKDGGGGARIACGVVPAAEG